jgi:hypothetical protein
MMICTKAIVIIKTTGVAKSIVQLLSDKPVGEIAWKYVMNLKGTQSVYDIVCSISTCPSPV